MKSIPTIYENKHVLALNKPSGLMVHPDGKNNTITLADKILEEYPELKKVGEPMRFRGKGGKEKIIYRPGIVHRLDKDTSGVLLVAKDQETFLFLKSQFKERQIKKTYRAIVFGSMKEKSGVINRPLGRSPGDFRKFSAHKTARGELREAITEYKVLKNFKTKEGEFTYLELYPKTGRTHQLRAHLKFINYPIVCDSIYAGRRGCALGMSRLALHAFSISFALPNGKKLTCEAEIPADFVSALTD
ncbi:MAG: RluA family pseudouridine synthase [Patescibacteria group bacterium]